MGSQVAALQKQFDDKRAEKQTIENRAMNTRRKMELAQQLIDGLQGERERWTEDSKLFKAEKKALVGDCAVASMFLSYCGAFNQVSSVVCAGKENDWNPTT